MANAKTGSNRCGGIDLWHPPAKKKQSVSRDRSATARVFHCFTSIVVSTFACRGSCGLCCCCCCCCLPLPAAPMSLTGSHDANQFTWLKTPVLVFASAVASLCRLCPTTAKAQLSECCKRQQEEAAEKQSRPLPVDAAAVNSACICLLTVAVACCAAAKNN